MIVGYTLICGWVMVRFGVLTWCSENVFLSTTILVFWREKSSWNLSSSCSGIILLNGWCDCNHLNDTSPKKIKNNSNLIIPKQSLTQLTWLQTTLSYHLTYNVFFMCLTPLNLQEYISIAKCAQTHAKIFFFFF